MSDTDDLVGVVGGGSLPRRMASCACMTLKLGGSCEAIFNVVVVELVS